MNSHPQKPVKKRQKNQENLLAPNPCNVLEFHKYTQRVWSKVAGRDIAEEEADEIIENFGRFLRALLGKTGG